MTTKRALRRAAATFAIATFATGAGMLAPSAHAATAPGASAAAAKTSQAPDAVGWMNVLTWQGAKTQACGKLVKTTAGDAIQVIVRTNNRKGTAKASSSFTTVNHGEPGPNNWIRTGFVAPGKISKMISRTFNPNHRAYYKIEDEVGGTALRRLRVDNLPDCPASVGN